jgi:hypothetical protein
MLLEMMVGNLLDIQRLEVQRQRAKAVAGAEVLEFKVGTPAPPAARFRQEACRSNGG